MDRVRFGRALGVGARAAAKSLLSAAEAAAAPSPAARQGVPTQTAPRPAAATTRPVAPRIVADPKLATKHVRTLGRSVWTPFARFSSVLWLEVTGCFFAIFALIAGGQVWKWRAAIRLSPSASDAQRLYVYGLVFAVFGYFAVSSFVRASRRQRR